MANELDTIKIAVATDVSNAERELKELSEELGNLKNYLFVLKKEQKQAGDSSRNFADEIKMVEAAISLATAQQKNTTKALQEYKQQQKEAIAPLRGFKDEQKQLRAELLGLDKGTKEYNEKIKALGATIDKMGDRMKEARAASDDWDETMGRMVSTGANMGKTLISGFQAIKGSVMLLGGNTKNLEKQMQTLFTLMATTQAFSAFASGITKVIQQMKLLRASMAANPITAWVTGLTALAAAVTAFFATGGLDKLRSWFTGVETDAQKAKKEMDLLKSSVELLDRAGLGSTPLAVSLKLKQLAIELSESNERIAKLDEKINKPNIWTRFIVGAINAGKAIAYFLSWGKIKFEPITFDNFVDEEALAKKMAELDHVVELKMLEINRKLILEPPENQDNARIKLMASAIKSLRETQKGIEDSDAYKSMVQLYGILVKKQAAEAAKHSGEVADIIAAGEAAAMNHLNDLGKKLSEKAIENAKKHFEDLAKGLKADAEKDFGGDWQIDFDPIAFHNQWLDAQNLSQGERLQSQRDFYAMMLAQTSEGDARYLELKAAFNEADNALNEQRVAAAQQSLQSIGSVLGSLADLYQQQADNAEEGSAEQEKLLKEAKNMQIAQAIINGLAGAVGVFAQSAAQGGIPGMIAGAIAAASLLVTTGIQIKQIEETDISRKKKAAAKTAKKPPKAPNAQALTPQMNVTRQQGFEREQLNQTANVSRQAEAMQDRRVYILESDLQASNYNVRARVRETTF